MKKWIFAASVAVIAMFAMVGCNNDPDPGPTPPPPPPPPPNMVTITFDLGYPGAPSIEAKEIEEDTTIDPLPSPYRPGYVFQGWFNTAGTFEYTVDYQFPNNTTLYAKWILDSITVTGADELLYLTNGAYAVYQFDIPSDKTLADYEFLNFESKLSEAGLFVWNKVGIRGIRLYGVYIDETISTAGNAGFDLPDVKYFDLNTLNTPYRITNPGTASYKDSAEADEWFEVSHDLAGDGNAENDPHKPASQTGTVYFALGISCQTTAGGTKRSDAFLQLIKDIKLVPKEATDTPVLGKKPAASYAQFLAFNDPIVFEWRGDPTTANYANPPLPALPEDSFDRGDPPEDADLRQVVLSGTTAPGFTYRNKNNPNNQAGWVSFGEAGQANDQAYNKPESDYTGPDSTIAFKNFINAWYLVVEAEQKPSGTMALIWMGDAGAWMSKDATETSGAAKDGTSWITPDDPDNPTKYTIKILLPKALLQYGRYFNDNAGWAGLALGYWGDNTISPRPDLSNMGISKAYLLVDKDDLEQEVTSGIGLGLSFTLGTAPAGGDLIDAVEIVSDDLVITTKSGLTDYRWYVDGVVKAGETADSLTFAANDGFVTVYAKRGDAWVSQTVYITVGSRD